MGYTFWKLEDKSKWKVWNLKPQDTTNKLKERRQGAHKIFYP